MDLFGLSRGFRKNCHFEEVNDTDDFEASKMGGPIDRES